MSITKTATIQSINPAISRAQYLRRIALVLDTETTGSSRQNDEVIELGVVRASNGEVLVDQRFRPSKRIEPFAFKVHGISDNALMNEAPFSSRWAEYAALLSDAVVIGWNVVYDRQMLEATCRKYDLTMPQIEWVDLMPLYREFRRAAKNCKLADACAEMGVRAGDHSAKADALATARVLFKMAGPVEEAPTEATQEELFDPTITHEWELAEIQDYYTEEPERETEEELPARILTDQRFGTAEALLRPDGSIHIPFDARPALRWWLPGAQSFFLTLAQQNAPREVWAHYGAKDDLLLTEAHSGRCGGMVGYGEDFSFCATCGYWTEATIIEVAGDAKHRQLVEKLGF